MAEYDSPWKEALEHYFEQFMQFFFPDAHADIDWRKGYEFLDKELEKIVRDAEIGRRLVDKLVKVSRKGGGEELVLVHLEVQGNVDRHFARRMYIYNYRLFDRYECLVASFAVLADEDRGWRPEEFSYELWGSRAGLRFPVVKLSDFWEKWEELEESKNPFAVIVMAHLRAKADKNNAEGRYNWKLRLTKALYMRGFSRKDVLELFRFIDWVFVLPADMDRQFLDEVYRFEEEKKMTYVTTVERIGIQKGMQEGIQKGMQKGMQKGIQKGMQKGVHKGEAILLIRQLERRFGSLPDWVRERVEGSDTGTLEKWGINLLEADTLDEVFDM